MAAGRRMGRSMAATDAAREVDPGETERERKGDRERKEWEMKIWGLIFLLFFTELFI